MREDHERDWLQGGGMIISLSESEMQAAGSIGVSRYIKMIVNGLGESRGSSPVDGWQRQVEGAMGEMAAAGAPPMGEAPGMDIEQDSAMLAEAVVGRAQGDVGAAIAVLDTAKAMLISSVEQPPMDGPPMGEPPMQAAYGKPLMKRGGGPLYRQGGGTMANEDILRQMIMDNLQNLPKGVTPSDILSDRELAIAYQDTAKQIASSGFDPMRGVVSGENRNKAMDEVQRYRMRAHRRPRT